MRIRTALATALLMLVSAAQAQKPFTPPPPTFEGYLCCNMRSNGRWVSDINYVEGGQTMLAAGTPIKIAGYGRQRVLVVAGDKSFAIGNDYSRDLNLTAFARRYVVKADPATKLAAYPAPLRDAIRAGHIRKGMTRAQVLMAVGYPVTSENPSLEASRWRYWLSSFAEYQVEFGADGLVSDVVGEVLVKRDVFED